MPQNLPNPYNEFDKSKKNELLLSFFSYLVTSEEPDEFRVRLTEHLKYYHINDAIKESGMTFLAYLCEIKPQLLSSFINISLELGASPLYVDLSNKTPFDYLDSEGLKIQLKTKDLIEHYERINKSDFEKRWCIKPPTLKDFERVWKDIEDNYSAFFYAKADNAPSLNEIFPKLFQALKNHLFYSKEAYDALGLNINSCTGSLLAFEKTLLTTDLLQSDKERALCIERFSFVKCHIRTIAERVEALKSVEKGKILGAEEAKSQARIQEQILEEKLGSLQEQTQKQEAELRVKRLELAAFLEREQQTLEERKMESQSYQQELLTMRAEIEALRREVIEAQDAVHVQVEHLPQYSFPSFVSNVSSLLGSTVGKAGSVIKKQLDYTIYSIPVLPDDSPFAPLLSKQSLMDLELGRGWGGKFLKFFNTPKPVILPDTVKRLSDCLLLDDQKGRLRELCALCPDIEKKILKEENRPKYQSWLKRVSVVIKEYCAQQPTLLLDEIPQWMMVRDASGEVEAISIS